MAGALQPTSRPPRPLPSTRLPGLLWTLGPDRAATVSPPGRAALSALSPLEGAIKIGLHLYVSCRAEGQDVGVLAVTDAHVPGCCWVALWPLGPGAGCSLIAPAWSSAGLLGWSVGLSAESLSFLSSCSWQSPGDRKRTGDADEPVLRTKSFVFKLWAHPGLLCDVLCVECVPQFPHL